MADYRVLSGQVPVSSMEANRQEVDRRVDEQEKGLVGNGAAAQISTSAGYGSLKGPSYMTGMGTAHAEEKDAGRFTETRFPALRVRLH